MANMLENGRTPILSPAELGEIGFAMVSYPVTMIFRIVKTMQQALKDLQEGKPKSWRRGVGFDEFKEIIGFKERVESPGWTIYYKRIELILEESHI